MIEKIENEQSGVSTRLYFGSAIVATDKDSNGDPTLSFFFKSLIRFHELYSRALLSTARKRLIKMTLSRTNPTS